MPAAIVTQLPEATSPAHRAALILVAFVLLLLAFDALRGDASIGAISPPRRWS